MKKDYSFFIGDVALDEYYSAPYFPKIKEKIVVRTLDSQIGGMVANAASIYAAYEQNPCFLAMLNSGPTTQRLCKELQNSGVDTSYVQYNDDLPDSKTIIILSEKDHEHTVFIPTLGLQHFEIDRAVLEKLCGAKYIFTNIVEIKPLCCGPLKAIEILKQVRAGGATVVFDLDVADIEPEDENLLSEVDILFLNELGIQRLSGNETMEIALNRLFNYGVQMVVVTRAEMGAEVFTKEKHIKVEGHKVEVVDVTGAGDTFCSSFIFAWDKTRNIQIAAAFANGAAARAVTMMGARSGIASSDTILDFLVEKGYKREEFRELERRQ